jgi:lipopolysaccharide heptosyltransferase II
VLRLLKRHLAHSQIYWWIDVKLAPLLEGDRDLAGLLLFDRHRWAAPRHWGELWQSVRRMRELAFDWVIDLQSLIRSGAFAWLANGSLTVGLDEPREGARGFYDLAARRPSYYTHAVDWYLGVLPLLGVPVDWNFDWLPQRPQIARLVREKWPVDSRRWIVIQPGARWVNKRWPAEHFAETVRRLAHLDPPRHFAILGGPEDRSLGKTIAQALPDRCLDLTGALGLQEMLEWIRSCELMITNDTGPMHVAAALGKQVAALFGPTEPRRTGPYGQLEHTFQSNLPCIPCMKSRCHYSEKYECLRSLSPAVVSDAVRMRLSLTSRAPANGLLNNIMG